MSQSNKKVVIIDYDMGNVGSVKNALDFIKIESVISRKSEDIRRATHLILPGVGSYGEGIRKLQQHNMMRILNEEVLTKKKPFLGICLGMQILSEIGEEDGLHKGLGWIEGRTRLLIVNKEKLRLPHVGWNDVQIRKRHTLFANIAPNIFYFVHSYVLEPSNKSLVIANCKYGETFCASVAKNNILGVQFHPEKSQKSGLNLLNNFLNLFN